MHAYRAELDGLRCVAVAAVIVNHFNSRLLPGGYLGVDIFFVISGYVITLSLLNQQPKGFFGFQKTFLFKRAKRILPALIVYFLVGSILISLFDPNPQDSLRTGISSIFGLSNMYLYRQVTDYFATSTDFNMFVQTWSLGVEEQFYFLYPFLIYPFLGASSNPSSKKKIYLATTLGALSIASFLLFGYLAVNNRFAAYFWMPSRFWEIALGALVLLLNQHFDPLARNSNILPAAAAFFLFATFFIPESHFSVGIPVASLLTALLIGALHANSRTKSILQLNALTHIGKISYSLYLWHWGVLVISRLTIGIHWWSVPFQLLFIYFAARVSYAVVEVPLRSINSPRRVLQLSLTAVATSSAIGLLLIKPLFGNLYLGGNKKVRQEYPELPDGRRLRKTVCFEAEPNQIDEVIDRCLLYPRSKKGLIWLIGDSHAEALLPAAAVAAADNEMGLFAYASGITVFPSLPLYRAGEKAFDLARVNAMNAIQDQILQNINKGDVLVLGLRYPFYFIDESHEYPASTLRYVGITPADSVRSSKSKFFNEWKEAINEFSSNLNRIGAHLVILTPTPEYPGALGGKCNIEFVEWFNRLQNPSCAVKKLEFIDGEGIYAELISWQETFSNDHDNVYLFNAFEIMCPKATCNYSQETTQFYRDDDHISNYSSAFVLGPKLSLFISTISEK